MSTNSNGVGTVTIDNVEYSLADLSADIQAQLGSIQAVDRRIASANEELAILQTARIAYANAVKDMLPQRI